MTVILLLTGPADAQRSRGKRATGKSAAEQLPADMKPFEEIGFAASLPKLEPGLATPYRDSTPAGRARASEIRQRTRRVFQERNEVESTRRPLIGPRDTLLGEVRQLAAVIQTAQATIAQASRRAEVLQQQLKFTNNQDVINAVYSELNSLTQVVNNANGVIRVNNDQIGRRRPQIEALNRQIAPLDARLRKLWQELNECRSQWLEASEPVKKYMVADYEALRETLDDWLLIDGYWPDAHCWRCLCAYEQGQYEQAAEYLRKAAEVRQQLNLPLPWPQGRALQGLIALHSRKVPGRSSSTLRDALVLNRKMKDVDWVTPFIVGRAWFETESRHARARAQFEKTLEINPEAGFARYWLARLQTESDSERVRDPAAAVQNLEWLWNRSSQQSWRLAHALAAACDAAGRSTDADRMWDRAEQLAPPLEQSALRDLRKNRAR